MALAALYDGHQVEILGDAESLLAFSRMLQDDRLPTSANLVAHNDGTADGSLSRLLVRDAEGLVVVGHDRGTLTIAGHPDMLCMLGQNVGWFADNCDPLDRGAHTHIEHFPDHPWMAAESVPVILRFL